MLLIALGATLVGFALLVIALVNGSLWLAVACIVVSIVGIGFLVADILGVGSSDESESRSDGSDGSTDDPASSGQSDESEASHDGERDDASTNGEHDGASDGDERSETRSQPDADEWSAVGDGRGSGDRVADGSVTVDSGSDGSGLRDGSGARVADPPTEEIPVYRDPVPSLDDDRGPQARHRAPESD